MYENKEGKLHTHDFDNSSRAEHEAEKKDKIEETESIYIKYLMSMKFFFKSSLVGVECRIKTEKGNKHIQIGNCEPHVIVWLILDRIWIVDSSKQEVDDFGIVLARKVNDRIECLVHGGDETKLRGKEGTR